MADNTLVWLVGALVVFVLAINVVIPAAVTAAAVVVTAGSTTQTGELWDGTAATANTMAGHPVLSVTTFKSAAVHTTYNDTVLNVPGSRTLTPDTFAAHGGFVWDYVNFTITLQGVNASNNVTWVNGTCRGANSTYTTSPQTHTNVNSTCLTPGTAFTITFANNSEAGSAVVNVTNITMTYFAYNDDTAYTYTVGGNTITPTNTGHFYTTYLYGTAADASTNAVLLLLPLLVAVVVLLLFLRSSGVF